jgi:hypothetical protein
MHIPRVAGTRLLRMPNVKITLKLLLTWQVLERKKRSNNFYLENHSQVLDSGKAALEVLNAVCIIE